MVTRSALVLVLAVVCATPAAAADHVIAVAYFDSNSVDPELEPLGRGVADMLMTDLRRGDGIRIVERTRLTEVLNELELQRSQYIDEATAQQLGRGLGATLVVVGSVTSVLEGMRLDARVVEVEAGEVIVAVESTGEVGQFFDLEQELASRILDELNVPYDASSFDQRQDLTVDDVVDYAERIDDQDRQYIEHLDAIGEYMRRRMVFFQVGFDDGRPAGRRGPAYTVSEFAGVHTPYSFAERVGDQRLAEQIRQRRIASNVIGLSILGGGVGLFVGGIAQVASANDLPYGSTEADRMEAAGWAGFSVGLGLMVLVAPLTAGAIAPSPNLSAFYSIDEARALVDEYNGTLGRELGLDPAETKRIDVLGRAPRVQVTPYLALGSVGVFGTF